MHVTTVSLALRNSPRLPLATREKLQSIAHELGYRPDPDLSALVTYRKSIRRTKQLATLAYITHSGGRWDWKRAPAHAEFFDGAMNRASQFGYQLEHFWLGEPGLTPRRLSGILFSRSIQGLIFASHWDCDDSLRDFDWPRFSGVAIDFLPPLPALHTVTNDQRSMIQVATRRIRTAGYRRIGLVMPRWWAEIGNLAWSAGFLAEQLKLPEADRIPILFYGGEGVDLTPPAQSSLAVAPDELTTWLDRFQPDVLISYGPFLLPTLEKIRRRIPQDFAFVDLFLEDTRGRTAGIRQNCRRVGELAVELLASQLQQHMFGLPEFHTTTLVDGTWCDGESLPIRR